MTFWDSSALVCLVSEEEGADELHAVFTSKRIAGVWWGTKTETTSAIQRVRRNRAIDEAKALQLLQMLEEIYAGADEVEPSEEVRSGACRLLRRHDLRAGDALQLAAALVWADHHPTDVKFVCLDRRLRAAAEGEGFEVLPGW